MPRTEIQNKPTPEQLFELAGRCVALGKGERNRLVMHRLPSRVKYFRTAFLAPPDQSMYDFIFEDCYSVSRRFLGRVAVVRDKSWLLQVKETNSLFKGDQHVDECHIVHKFRWSGSQVLEASRIVNFVELGGDEYENYQPVQLETGVFQADLLHGANEMGRVSAGDCQDLLREISLFDQALRVSTT